MQKLRSNWVRTLSDKNVIDKNKITDEISNWCSVHWQKKSPSPCQNFKKGDSLSHWSKKNNHIRQTTDFAIDEDDEYQVQLAPCDLMVRQKVLCSLFKFGNHVNLKNREGRGSMRLHRYDCVSNKWRGYPMFHGIHLPKIKQLLLLKFAVVMLKKNLFYHCLFGTPTKVFISGLCHHDYYFPVAQADLSSPSCPDFAFLAVRKLMLSALIDAPAYLYGAMGGSSRSLVGKRKLESAVRQQPTWSLAPPASFPHHIPPAMD